MNGSRHATWFLCALLAAACAAPRLRLPASTAAPVAIAVLPSFVYAGGATRVSWRIDPSAANRGYCLAFVDDDGTERRQSCAPLEGADAPRFFSWTYDGMTSGQITLWLTVWRTDGRVLRATTTLCILGMETPCGDH